jgi:hypothetical protein
MGANDSKEETKPESQLDSSRPHGPVHIKDLKFVKNHFDERYGELKLLGRSSTESQDYYA